MTRNAFYKSKKWETFRKVIIEERTDADGFVRCAICGKPIINKYDLIVHHIKELDDSNVNDASIALNPDNVQCVHFKCHNKLHERFGYHTTSAGGSYKPVKKNVYIVYGAPCSGRRTWVHDVATEDDLIVDQNAIYAMISVGGDQTSGALKSVVFDIRDKLYDVIRYRSGKWHNAYIITSGALLGDRLRLIQRVGADDCVYIDTDMQTCLKRAKGASQTDKYIVDLYQLIIDWFDRFQPDE